jgi:GrpB-like predicted nucleotidyltransferase (UPF0157 family)
MPRPVVIVPYDPEWPRIYEEEKKLIQGTVGSIIRSIEHVGSTSVTGLWAKPIIDIIAGVDGAEDAERCRELLVHLGYDDASPWNNPDWYYCLGKGPHSPGFHLHLVKEGSQFHRKHIIFRNWLREHPADADAYRDLKISLSEKHRNDRLTYTQSKTAFIDGIVEKAKKLGSDDLLE